MNLLRKKIVVDTITQSGETFDVDMTVSFTVINKGATNCSLSYQGGPPLMVVEKGTAREFPGDSGYTFFGTMQLNFIGSNTGNVEIIKSVASTNEY